MLDLTTIILTKNESLNLSNAIESIKNISKRVIVVDSFSEDATVEIAKKYNTDIFFNKFINYGTQFQWALDNCKIETKWVFRFDADEILTKVSELELVELISKNNHTNVNGIIFNLEINFLGKKLKHGGVYPFRKLCIFKFGKAYMESREMDEQIILTEGKSIKMNTVSIHHDYKDLTAWIDKHNKYSTRAARDFLNTKSTNQEIKKLDKVTILRRIIKYKIFYRLPVRLRSAMYFIYRYYLRFGFLDGYQGYLYSFFQAYWYRVLVDAKIYEIKARSQKN